MLCVRGGDALEVGEEQLEPARDRVDVARLREERELGVQPAEHREQRGRERRELWGVSAACA